MKEACDCCIHLNTELHLNNQKDYDLKINKFIKSDQSKGKSIGGKEK